MSHNTHTKKIAVNKPGLRKQLAIAACALVSSGLQAAEDWTDGWEVDGSYLSYSEAGERVTVNKTLLDFQRELDDGTINVGLVHDAMSGSSPTGAIRSTDSLVTFSSPSSRNGFTTSNGSDGALTQFSDTRIQLSASR